MLLLDILNSCKDESYKSFQASLLPTVSSETIIGVRTPDLKKIAKSLSQDEKTSIITSLPHKYFEENQIHAFVINDMKNLEDVLKSISDFLPFVDNWATCDQLRPKVFAKYHERLLPYVYNWLKSSHGYTVRYAVGLLMTCFLEEDYEVSHLSLVKDAYRDDYYVNMMRSWYYATALVKQEDSVLPFIKSSVLDSWTQNKTIQKARESYRISKELKEELLRYKK